MRDLGSCPVRRIDCSDSRPKHKPPCRGAVTGLIRVLRVNEPSANARNCVEKCGDKCGSGKVRWNMDEMGWFLKARKNYKSCATTEFRWLFRGSPSSLRNLWSAVIKRPNLLARGGGSPESFLQGAFVILVLLQTSQFRSWWKWVKVLCLLGATLEVLNLIHEKCLRMLPILHPRDYLWTPSTPGDLASGFPLLVGCRNFDIVLWFWGAITSASRCLL